MKVGSSARQGLSDPTNKDNSSDTEAPFLDFNLSITNDIVFS